MNRTHLGGPWTVWLVVCALITFGLTFAAMSAFAQDGDEDLLGGDDLLGDDDVGGGDDLLGDDDEIGGLDEEDGEILGGDEDIVGSDEAEDLGGVDEVKKKERDVRAEGQMSFLQMLSKGGPLMFVLLGIQIVVLTLVLESAFNVNGLRVLPIDLVDAIEDDFEKNDVDAVVQKCEENPGMLANVLHAGLTAPSSAEGDVKEAIELAGEHEGEAFMTHVGYLSIFGAIAPMVGLLGTVTGMIIAFGRVATEAAIGKPELLAGGIYQALFTTAFGLIVGIPAMFMYYYFKNRGIKILMVVENSVKRFMKWRTQPDNRGVPRGGLVPQRLALLIDEALSNAFVGIMPIVGFILGPFAIAKAVKIKGEMREVTGGPTGAAATEPWKATTALVLGVVDIVIWPLVAIAAIVLGAL